MRKICNLSWLNALMLAFIGLSPISTLDALGQDQEMRSLSIVDGQVYLDGRQLPPDELPTGLDVEGVQLTYAFSGDVRPVVEVNGAFFTIEAEGLREVSRTDQGDGVSVFFGQREAAPPDRLTFRTNRNQDDIVAVAAPHAASIEQHARALEAQAAHFQELQLRLQDQFGEHQIAELNEAARRLERQAQQAVLAAEALPQLELRQYLDTIERQDRELYDRLVDERRMERETILLSERIRRTDNEAERAGLTDELRTKLNEIFELKQDNRRREIEQFESRLEDLQSKLAERERLRDQIIENRLRQLLDKNDEATW